MILTSTFILIPCYFAPKIVIIRAILAAISFIAKLTIDNFMINITVNELLQYFSVVENLQFIY